MAAGSPAVSTELSGASRGLGAAGSGVSEEPWKNHIIRQLKNRDRDQRDPFQDVIRLYARLLDKTSLTKGFLGCSRRPSGWSNVSLKSLLHNCSQLKKTTGELAFQVLELQQQIKSKECFLDEQHSRLAEVKQQVEDVGEVRKELQEKVEQVQEENRVLKVEYDKLLECRQEAESRLQVEKVQGEDLVEDLMGHKKQAAARMNSRNERRSRAREANLHKELQSAARSKVNIDRSTSAPTSRSASPKNDKQEEPKEQRPTRLFRSASVTSSRFFSSIKELFERKRRGHTFCSLEEDLIFPAPICFSARLPARALEVLEAHEQGINAVRFSRHSHLVATGGTDRVVKLWDVGAGSMTLRGTLEGSTQGITCIDFDHTGSRILGASYDNSALLWQLENSVARVTLTGHSRKVTAARFTGVQQVATGSTDRTVRLWDLNRAACVRLVEVTSCCSDLVSSQYCIISSHYDSKIRVWDSRAVGCIQELPAQGKVTSLDLSTDQRHLLSCSRDNCLQLLDLRMWSNLRICFRADGFKCGSDSTKAVISPDSCYVAVGSADGAIYIWNASSGDLETSLPDQHSSSINAISWSPSGEYVVSVDRSRRAVLWSDL